MCPRLLVFSYGRTIYVPLFRFSINIAICVFETCSMTRTLERYQKLSYGGPDTAIQNKENEVTRFY